MKYEYQPKDLWDKTSNMAKPILIIKVPYDKDGSLAKLGKNFKRGNKGVYDEYHVIFANSNDWKSVAFEVLNASNSITIESINELQDRIIKITNGKE